jgi:hypothetical protein
LDVYHYVKHEALLNRSALGNLFLFVRFFALS